MTPPKSVGSTAVTVAVAALVLAAVAPMLIDLSAALLPLVIVFAIAATALRLVFVHTRRW
jgi:hypothetical protein